MDFIQHHININVLQIDLFIRILNFIFILFLVQNYQQIDKSMTKIDRF